MISFIRSWIDSTLKNYGIGHSNGYSCNKVSKTWIQISSQNWKIGGSWLWACRPALREDQKYQMVKTQTESHIRSPIVWTNRWQIWVRRGMAVICHSGLGGQGVCTLNSMYRSGLVNTLVTHATNTKGFGLTSLSGVRHGFMPPQLKTKQNQQLIQNLPTYLMKRPGTI